MMLIDMNTVSDQYMWVLTLRSVFEVEFRYDNCQFHVMKRLMTTTGG